MTYSIWLVPSDVYAKNLNKVIKNLAKTYCAPEFPAHITAYSGIHSIGKARAALKQVKSGPITANKINIGQSDYLWKTLFVNIKKDRSLRTIHLALQKNLDEKYQFLPHISLIYKKLDESTKRKIKSEIKIKNRFVFDRITIIRSSKNPRKWKKLHSVSLNATRHA